MKLKKRKHYDGETKIVSKFLWFPVVVDYLNHWEIRWLEKATIEYKYENCWGDCWWTPFRFID